jgi:DNA polymerase III epsilon subunit family exonuclease
MYCVIDFETTGLSPHSCDVIEYAAMRIGGDREGEFIESLCAPVRSAITPKITEINGIRPGDVAGKAPFGEHLHHFLDFIGDDIIVAHNIPFDMGFLRRYCGDLNIIPPQKTKCTLAMARRMCRLRSYSLKAVAESFSIRAERYHRALDDVRVTAQVLHCLLEMSPS